MEYTSMRVNIAKILSEGKKKLSTPLCHVTMVAGFEKANPDTGNSLGRTMGMKIGKKYFPQID